MNKININNLSNKKYTVPINNVNCSLTAAILQLWVAVNLEIYLQLLQIWIEKNLS